jgi:hypothetical protein
LLGDNVPKLTLALLLEMDVHTVSKVHPLLVLGCILNARGKRWATEMYMNEVREAYFTRYDLWEMSIEETDTGHFIQTYATRYFPSPYRPRKAQYHIVRASAQILHYASTWWHGAKPFAPAFWITLGFVIHHFLRMLLN